MLKVGGKLYTITDVEDLHQWHVETINSSPCFKRIPDEEVEKDIFIQFMKNTDEARKVQKKMGGMYYAVYERIMPSIKSIGQLYKMLK